MWVSTCPWAWSGLMEIFWLHLQMRPLTSAQGKKTNSRRKKMYWKKCFRTAVPVSFPLLTWEKPFKSGKAQIGTGVATLTQKHRALLTVLAVSQTHPYWNYSLQFGLQMWSEKSGAECYSKEEERDAIQIPISNITDSACTYSHSAVLMCYKSQCRNAILQ